MFVEQDCLYCDEESYIDADEYPYVYEFAKRRGIKMIEDYELIDREMDRDWEIWEWYKNY